MNSPSADHDLLDRLADSFAERYRRGERPSLKDYTDRYPHLAAQIRALFPTLVLMEELGPARGDPTGPFPPPPPDAGAAPSRLGEYRLLREVGRGGMGVVYEAVQESLGRHVALKVLPFHGSLEPMHLERFRQEARVAARLHHTNIVPVFGVGEVDGVHYYAMQFIQGQGLDAVLKEIRRLRGQTPDGPAPEDERTRTLAQALETGQFRAGEPHAVGPEPPPPAAPPTAASGSHSGLTSASGSNYYRSVAQVGVQVAEALAYAHKQGVLHRDVKPSNLLLDTHGTVWVSDFGLAKAEGAGELTSPGDIVGTLRYMAPERFRGPADARSDVYGLGMTLYEMLTLRPAFPESDRPRLIERVLHEEPPRPRACDPHVPRDLETVILKAIAKDPRVRYPTPAALAEDLRRFLADRPVRARRSSSAERAWRWCRRNPAVAGLLAALALALVLIAAGSSVAALWLGRERDVARANEWEATRARKDALEKLWESYLAQARAGRWSGQPGRRFAGLSALAKAARIKPSPELRNEAIACLALPDIELAQTVRTGRGTAAAFDPAFERYAVSDREGNVTVRRVADNEQLARLPGQGTYAWILRFSPDGRFLAAVYDLGGAFKLWDLRRKVPALELFYAGFDFSPDGSCLAAHTKGFIDLYELPSGRLRKRVPHPGAKDAHLAFHPSGRRLAFAGGPDTKITVYDLDEEKTVQTLARPSQLASLRWHPDGQLLAGACAADGIFVWDVTTGRRLAVCTEPAGDFRALSFNHAGNLLASTGWDDILRLWDPWTGRLVLRGPNTGSGLTLQFSRDDTLLLGSRGRSTLKVWKVDSCRERRSWNEPGPGGAVEDASFSPDGRLLATTSRPGVRLRDLDTGKGVAFLPQPGSRGALFLPSGKALLVYGDPGLYSWPLARDGGGLRVGPPQRLGAPASLLWASLRPDGREAVLVRATGEAVVMDLQTRRARATLRGKFRIAEAALSPDGRWAATVNQFERGEGIRVWDTHTEKEVHQPPGQGVGRVAFSPDGRWLLTAAAGDDAYRFWRVGSWEAGRRLPRDELDVFLSRPAFSPDAKVLAVSHAPRTVHLLEAETGAELGVLTSPEPLSAGRLCFSPDGTRLAVVLANQLVEVWDLRLTRARLAEMGLDWDAPPYPAAPEVSATSLRVRVLPGTASTFTRPAAPEDLRAALAKADAAVARDPKDAEALYQRGLVHMRLREFAPARDDFTRALKLKPNHAEAHHQRGHAHEGLGQPARAVEDFTAALEARPEDAHLLEARAFNHFVLKNHAQAVRDLRRALAIKPDQPSACNLLAWIYLTGPADRRDPEKARALAEKATQLAPGQWQSWQTLGLAYHRVGKEKEALQALERGAGMKKGGASAYDLLVMAMCHQRLGDRAKAKDCYDRAVRWRDEHKGKLSAAQAETFESLRAEAEAALARAAKP
jgi:eukaryotic-like serine/threonine-protein kinase